MRALIPLFIVAATLAATTISAIPHVVNEFEIPLPNAPAAQSAQALSNDIFAVLTTVGITAVNLSTKVVAWNSPSDSVTDFTIANGAVVAVGSNYVEGISVATGHSLWKNMSINVFSEASSITFKTFTTNVVVMTEDDLFSVNAATGAVLYQKSIQGTTFPAGDSLYYTNSNSKLVSLNLETGVEAWKISAGASGDTFEPVLYADSKYVVTTISSFSGDTILFVADATNGNQKLRLEGMSGINQDAGPVSISGSNLTVVAGETPRQYVIDLNTGFIISQKPFGNGGGGGGGGGAQGAYSLPLSNGDVLKIHSTNGQTIPAKYGQGFTIEKSTQGGAFVTVCPHTASSASFNMAYLGDGLLKVGNLQGWVLFYIQANTCTTLKVNEAAPGYTTNKGGAVYKFGMDYIEVEGSNVVGYKIVM